MKLATATPVLAVRHAEKRFGAVQALRDVSLEAYRSEVSRCLETMARVSQLWSNASAACIRSMAATCY